MTELKATEFVSEEQLKDAFGALHEITTNQGERAQDRIGAAYALIDHCRQPEYQPDYRQPEPDEAEAA